MPTDQRSTVLNSPAFRREALRSDQRRIVLTIAVVSALVVFSVFRDLVMGDTPDLPLVALTLAIGAVLVLFETASLVLVRRALARDASPPGWLLPTGVVVEALVPTVGVLDLTTDAVAGPYRALLFPVILLYPIFIALSTLRLRPSLCWLSGVVSATGYLGATALTVTLFPDVGPPVRLPGLIYVTVAVAILATAWVAAAIADQLRQRLTLLLHAADARRLVENRARDTLIFALAKLAEHRDTDTGAHLARISAYSAALASRLAPEHEEIDADWIDRIRVASSLHDIGKVGLPDGVLKKPGPLTDDERSLMQSHPALGADTLEAIRARDDGAREDPLLAMSEAIAAAHHERWDGTGYPRGRAGRDIPLAARIVALADVYDALTSRRVYKPPMPHEEARRIIEEGRETQFDPEVIDAFLAIEDRFRVIREDFDTAESAAASSADTASSSSSGSRSER